MAVSRSLMIRVAHENPDLRPHILPFVKASKGREAVNLPPSVERYVKETKEQSPGIDEGAAWGIAWSRYCVAANTLVNTSHGMLTVKELAGKAVGQKVVHDDGVVALALVTAVATHEGQAHTSHIVATGTKETVELKTKHGYRLECTSDHRVLVLAEDYSTEWVPAGECSGRIMVLPTEGVWGRLTKLPDWNYESRTWNNVVPMRQPQELTHELARVLGYLVAEGSITEEGVEFSNTDPRVVEDYTRCMLLLFGEEPSVKWEEPNPKHRRVKRSAKVRSRTRWYKEFFTSLGMAPGTARDKVVPSTILSAPRKYITEFLRGFGEGDGFAGDTEHANRIDLTTSSATLARQLHLLLANLGILSTFETTKRGYFNIRVHSETMARLYTEKVGFVFKQATLSSKRQRKRGSEFDCIPADALTNLHKRIANTFPGTKRVSLSRLRRHWHVLEECVAGHVVVANIRNLMDRGYQFDAVQSIESAGMQEVFDLTVPGDHSFVANGLLAHNCKYKNPGSPHCKKENPGEYFPGNKSAGQYELSDSELRAAVTKLANERPEFRNKLVPELMATKQAAADEMSWDQCVKAASDADDAVKISAALYGTLGKTAGQNKAAQVLDAATDLTHVGAYLLRLAHVDLSNVAREKVVKAAHAYAVQHGEPEAVARGIARIAMDIYQRKVTAMNHREQRTPADMISYLKEHGIFSSGGDVVRIDGDLTYGVHSAKPFRRTGIRIQGKETEYNGYESWDIIITPKKAVIKIKTVDEDYENEDVNTFKSIQILGAP